MTETSTQILQDIINTSGARAAVVVGRDGFVIETAGSLGSIDLDTLGASVAMLLSGAESMGSELHIDIFHTLTLEASNAMIMCSPVGDALLVILASDSKTLGMIRLQVKKHAPSLVQFF